MGMKTSPSHLEDFDLFNTLNSDDKADLAARFTYPAIKGGTVLIREGEASDRLYIVVSGRFSVSREGEPPLAYISPGAPVG